jgi:hypothetical protein
VTWWEKKKSKGFFCDGDRSGSGPSPRSSSDRALDDYARSLGWGDLNATTRRSCWGTFRAFWRWRRDGRWSAPEAFSDGRSDAWHTNVQARPDGSVLAGYDLGSGGSETTTYVVEGRDGRFGPPEDVSATSRPGERVHFAFHPGGGDWLAWFHKVRGLPLHVYARGGRPGAWSAVDELSAGYGGYHYDPFLAMAPNGTLAAVWGWDGGDSAELVYSVRRDAGWSAPMRAAALDDGKPELPSMDVDAAGRFHVVWANGVRGRTRVWYTTIDP